MSTAGATEALWFLETLVVPRHCPTDEEPYGLLESTARPGNTVPLHRHDEDEVFTVLEGELTITAGDETVVLGPGGFISSPPGARHGFRSAGGRAKVLNLHTPGAGFIDGIRRTSAKP